MLLVEEVLIADRMKVQMAVHSEVQAEDHSEVPVGVPAKVQMGILKELQMEEWNSYRYPSMTLKNLLVQLFQSCFDCSETNSVVLERNFVFILSSVDE